MNLCCKSNVPCPVCDGRVFHFGKPVGEGLALWGCVGCLAIFSVDDWALALDDYHEYAEPETLYLF